MTSDSSTARAPVDKLLGLEILRFLSAVAVLVWHYQHFWFVGGELAPGFVRSGQPLYPFFKLFYEWGVYGVQVFWFISGYIFFWKYLGAIRDGRVGAWRFFVLRASRLYPLHLLTFAGVAVLQFAYQARTGRFFVYQANDVWHAVLQLFMASNWGLQTADSYNGPIWSVSLEVLAYLGFFLFARWAGARTGVIVLIIVVSAVAYQVGLGQIFQCLFCFFVGGLVAIVGRSPWVVRHRRSIATAAVLYIAGFAVVAHALHLFDRKLLVHLYITTAAPLLIHLLAQRVQLSGGLARWVTVAGNTTYSSYLLHFPLQLSFMLWAVHSGWRVPREQPVFFLAYLALSLLLGVLAFRLFEMPMQGLLRRLGGYRPPAGASVQ